MLRQQVLRLVQSFSLALVPTLTADAGHQCSVCLNTLDGAYLVIGSLTQLHNGTYRHTDIAVAWCLTTPGRAIDPDTAVIVDSHHGVVIVHQFCALDVLQPQTRMGALARTAFA